MANNPPLNPSDPFEAASRLLNGAQENIPPTQTGVGGRQSQVPNRRAAIQKRTMLQWLVPEQPIIEMYINPQSLSWSYKKLITKTRTKGGFSVQYWGEDLIEVKCDGTTGTSGIEGINILLDVYRNEQLMFDPYALYLAEEKDRRDNSLSNDINIFGTGALGSGLNDVGNILINASKGSSSTGRESLLGSSNKPNLASLAFNVEMYWQGEVYKGYFTNFDFDEKATELGLFTYRFSFTAIQKRGYRNNYLGWHRSATNGPSNSSVPLGPPLSYGSLITGESGTPVINNIDQPNLNSSFIDPGQNGLNKIGGMQALSNKANVNRYKT